MSETRSESLRAPPIRPLSSISMLAERLKCSNLQDHSYDLSSVEPVDRSEVRVMHRARRPKAVNFTNDGVCGILIHQQRSSTASSDVDCSSVTCDSGNEDSSESWAGGVFPPSSSRAHEGADNFSIGLNSCHLTSQHCLSTSAPDGHPAPLLPAITDAGVWCEASEQKNCSICQSRPDSSENAPSRHPPSKRSCRSQSASSNQKSTNGTSSRRTIARPIALRISQRSLHSPVTSVAVGTGTSALSSTAYALVASGCVKLRNVNSMGHQPSTTVSRLSWHHPIACGGNRRFVVQPGPVGCSRHSVAFGGTMSELVGDVKLRKPPSLACISTSASNANDFSHHRLSAFTPTTQSRRMSLTGDEGEPENSMSTFSPNTASAPCGGTDMPSSAVHTRPTVSAASSGFFQDSCSLSHFSCCSSTNSDQHPAQVANIMHQYGLASKPMDPKVLQFDDSTASLSAFEQQQQLRQNHICTTEAEKLRCQSQPAGAAGIPACACGSVASAECLSRQLGLKRRRCSHDVGLLGEANSGAFLFGPHQSAGSFDGTIFNPDTAFASTTTETAMVGQEASISPLRLQQQQQGQTDLTVFPQDSEAAFLMACRRKELSGLSEASEEEESNEATLVQHQHQSCCALDEYDTGTLTPPQQSRFRPIASSPSLEVKDAEEDGFHHNHNSCSTEGSLCSFKANSTNIDVCSNKDDDEDSFEAIAPGLNHRRRYSPMQTEEISASAEKFHELDMDMIEQD